MAACMHVTFPHNPPFFTSLPGWLAPAQYIHSDIFDLTKMATANITSCQVKTCSFSIPALHMLSTFILTFFDLTKMATATITSCQVKTCSFSIPALHMLSTFIQTFLTSLRWQWPFPPFPPLPHPIRKCLTVFNITALSHMHFRPPPHLTRFRTQDLASLKARANKTLQDYTNELKTRKKNKFLRDQDDYLKNQVYRWRYTTLPDGPPYRNRYGSSGSSGSDGGQVGRGGRGGRGGKPPKSFFDPRKKPPAPPNTVSDEEEEEKTDEDPQRDTRPNTRSQAGKGSFSET
ncbi:uncharacterized protein [Dendrobates tinctorius]|uniref:uncharacterized protein n=2 Tax=Dendrobates tinctorius TaxID=92724 RepID=UPI003CCA2561